MGNAWSPIHASLQTETVSKDGEKYTPVFFTPNVEILTLTEAENHCPYCAEQLTKKSPLSHHIASHMGRLADLEGQYMLKYFCPVESCSFAAPPVSEEATPVQEDVTRSNIKHFRTLKQAKQHYRLVHLPKIFRCDTCPKSFTTDYYLKSHSKICGILYRCTCGKVFQTLPAYKNHAKQKLALPNAGIHDLFEIQPCQQPVEVEVFNNNQAYDNRGRPRKKRRKYNCNNRVSPLEVLPTTPPPPLSALPEERPQVLSDIVSSQPESLTSPQLGSTPSPIAPPHLPAIPQQSLPTVRADGQPLPVGSTIPVVPVIGVPQFNGLTALPGVGGVYLVQFIPQPLGTLLTSTLKKEFGTQTPKDSETLVNELRQLTTRSQYIQTEEIFPMKIADTPVELPKKKRSAHVQTNPVKIRVSAQTQTSVVTKRKRCTRKKESTQTQTQSPTKAPPVLTGIIPSTSTISTPSNSPGINMLSNQFDLISELLEVHSQTQTEPDLLLGENFDFISLDDNDVSELLGFVESKSAETQTKALFTPNLKQTPMSSNYTQSSEPSKLLIGDGTDTAELFEDIFNRESSFGTGYLETTDSETQTQFNFTTLK